MLYYSDPQCQIFQGDCLEVMKTLEMESVQMCFSLLRHKIVL